MKIFFLVLVVEGPFESGLGPNWMVLLFGFLVIWWMSLLLFEGGDCLLSTL